MYIYIKRNRYRCALITSLRGFPVIRQPASAGPSLDLAGVGERARVHVRARDNEQRHAIFLGIVVHPASPYSPQVPHLAMVSSGLAPVCSLGCFTAF